MIDQELLKACVLHPCSVTPRMMLIDSMIENGWEEFKAMEAFEPPTVSRCLPLNYSGIGGGSGYVSGHGHGHGTGSVSGRGHGRNSGSNVNHGIGRGIGQNRGHV